MGKSQAPVQGKEHRHCGWVGKRTWGQWDKPCPPHHLHGPGREALLQAAYSTSTFATAPVRSSGEGDYPQQVPLTPQKEHNSTPKTTYLHPTPACPGEAIEVGVSRTSMRKKGPRASTSHPRTPLSPLRLPNEFPSPGRSPGIRESRGSRKS